MGTLRNTSITNTFGDGYVQIYTDDDGNEYTIRNTNMAIFLGTFIAIFFLSKLPV